MPIPLPSPAIPIKLSLGMSCLTFRTDENPLLPFFNLDTIHYFTWIFAGVAVFGFHKIQNLFTLYLVQRSC